MFEFDQAKQFLQRAKDTENLEEREAHVNSAMRLLEGIIAKLEGQTNVEPD